MLRTIIAIFMVFLFFGLANGQELPKGQEGDGMPIKIKPNEKTHFKIYEFKFDYIDLQVKVIAGDLYYFNNLQLQARYRFNQAMQNKLTDLTKVSFNKGYATGMQETLKKHGDNKVRHIAYGLLGGLALGFLAGYVIARF